MPVSGEVAEAEAVIETGARPEEYGEHVGGDGPQAGQSRAAVPGVTPEPVEAPAPSRADVGRPAEAPAEPKESRRERRAREKEERRRTREREAQRAREQQAAEKRRGPVTGFIASCWAELKKVQWPDRDTLVQASAVTLIFVAVMAAYLGALDAAFNWLINRII
jgi:preprotein translocase SecE subunit